MDKGDPAAMAGALSKNECSSCDDRGGSNQAQSGCPLAACTISCATGPAAATRDLVLHLAFDADGPLGVPPGDASPARSVAPDPPPPR